MNKYRDINGEEWSVEKGDWVSYKHYDKVPKTNYLKISSILVILFLSIILISLV